MLANDEVKEGLDVFLSVMHVGGLRLLAHDAELGGRPRGRGQLTKVGN
jgi:hypothetical protein